MSEICSLCPNCLRPSLLMEPGNSVWDSVASGRVNITRTRDSEAYFCHGCQHRFDEPLKIARPGGNMTEGFQKYRKKPVVIEAKQITERMEIDTLEGTMVGEVGDWLIIGIKGERYPCKDDIFRASYEAVDA